MHREAARFLVVTAAVALAAAACGGKEPAPASSAPPSASAAPGAAAKKYRFAVMPKSLNLPVFFYAKTGAERAAKELGNVEVIWRAPEDADPLKQKEILESFITQGVDGIAISCTSADLLNEPINRAIEAGIPVVTWDSDAPRSKRIAFWGVDDFASGKIMGDEAGRITGGKGKLAIITSLGAENLARRLDGVKESLKKYPDLKVVETYDVKEDATRSAEIIATAMRRYPDLAVWVSVGGWPVFVRNALDPIDPAKTKFICFDTVPPAPDLLKTGKVQVLIGQKYFGWGGESVKLLAAIKEGKMPAQKVIDSGVDVVTPENVDAYLEQWKKWEKGE